MRTGRDSTAILMPSFRFNVFYVIFITTTKLNVIFWKASKGLGETSESPGTA